MRPTVDARARFFAEILKSGLGRIFAELQIIQHRTKGRLAPCLRECTAKRADAGYAFPGGFA
jgi:hypothetical protein